MKISELIEQAKKILESEGDLEAKIECSDCEYGPTLITNISVIYRNDKMLPYYLLIE